MAGGNYDRSKKNSQLNPAVAYAFALQVEAAFFLPLRSVRVFTKENEFDYYQEGGLNDYVHMLRKPISKPFTFQVERYVGVDSGFFDQNSGFLDPLALGTDLILPLVLYVNRSPAGNWYKNISFTNCARAYIFTGCTVISKEYGELNAEQSKLHTETVTIAYRELFTMNQISPGWEAGGTWEYDGTVQGSGESHTENRNRNVSEPMSKWNFPGAIPEEKTESVDHTGNRNTKNTKAAPSKWNFPGAKPTETTESVPHEGNRNKDGEKPASSKWNFPGAIPEETTPSVDHTGNRTMTDTQVKPSKWVYPGSRDQKDMVQALLKESGTNPKIAAKLTGEGDSHRLNRNENQKPPVSKWNFPGTREETPSTEHTSNRSTNTTKPSSKWNYPGAKPTESTATVDHTNNRSMSDTKAKPSKWVYPGSKEEGGSVDHTANRNVNTPNPPSKWGYIGNKKEEANGVEHAANRSINTSNPVSKWNYPGTKEATASTDHAANRSINTTNPPSKWNYPGSKDATESVNHTLNRNENKKETPVKWPPERRAMMAQALSEL